MRAVLKEHSIKLDENELIIDQLKKIIISDISFNQLDLLLSDLQESKTELE